jgi:hypothetical protein
MCVPGTRECRGFTGYQPRPAFPVVRCTESLTQGHARRYRCHMGLIRSELEGCCPVPKADAGCCPCRQLCHAVLRVDAVSAEKITESLDLIAQGREGCPLLQASGLRIRLAGGLSPLQEA